MINFNIEEMYKEATKLDARKFPKMDPQGDFTKEFTIWCQGQISDLLNIHISREQDAAQAQEQKKEQQDFEI